MLCCLFPHRRRHRIFQQHALCSRSMLKHATKIKLHYGRTLCMRTHEREQCRVDGLYTPKLKGRSLKIMKYCFGLPAYWRESVPNIPLSRIKPLRRVVCCSFVHCITCSAIRNNSLWNNPSPRIRFWDPFCFTHEGIQHDLYICTLACEDNHLPVVVSQSSDIAGASCETSLSF